MIDWLKARLQLVQAALAQIIRSLPLSRPHAFAHLCRSRPHGSIPQLEIDPVQRILLQITSLGMNYNIATILAVIAILFVLLTYVTGAPLVPVAVILLGLAIIFGGNAFRRV
jgi:type IV secretory pathway VirB2 component (pilin)